ncbi:MAG: glycosyltransferase, partial [Nitrososphaeraceae archaeon]|nr:glycosyltransferase [Nitrososphaeraceae archaeon]
HHKVDEEDLRSVYAGTKALAYISTSEAQGLPPMEALKMGTPVILKDYGLSRELFEDYAFYVRDETNVDEIAEVMKSSLEASELRERIKLEGKKMPGRFTWEKCVEKLIHEIRQLS